MRLHVIAHMLQHACGFALANDDQDTRAIQEWLGHQNIQHTTRYTDLTPGGRSGLRVSRGLPAGPRVDPKARLTQPQRLLRVPSICTSLGSPSHL